MTDLKRPIDILISNGQVLTMDQERRQLGNSSIAVDAGRILELGPASQVDERYEPRHRIDASCLLALPGLINGHNHLFQTMCRGLADGCDLSNLGKRGIWPVAALLDASACETAARLACLEMLESGTTTVVDSHFLNADPRAQHGIAQACLEAGIRAILVRAAGDLDSVPEPFRESAEKAVAATERFMAEWHGKGNRVLVRPEASSEAAASRELVLALRALSRQAETGFHMHVAEGRLRPEWLRQRCGYRSIEWLDHLGVLGADVVLAHCVWLNEGEMRMLAQSRTAVVHNPVSNQFLADGVAPVPELLARGVKVGLGTDGAVSNNSLDMFEVMKATALVHKVHSLRADVMDAWQVLDMATIGGARALGIDSITGSLEVGKRADILLVTLDSPRMIPRYSLVSNLVYSASSSVVDTVIVEGRILVAGGRCLSLDRKEVMAEARRLADFLRDKLGLHQPVA